MVATSARRPIRGKTGAWHSEARINDNVDVYTMKANGNDLRRLTDAPGFDICAAYSPDGNDITFCSNRTGFFEIWAMKANGSQQHQVTHLNGFATFPDYSPDGGRIAFGAVRRGTTNLTTRRTRTSSS